MNFARWKFAFNIDFEEHRRFYQNVQLSALIMLKTDLSVIRFAHDSSEFVWQIFKIRLHLLHHSPRLLCLVLAVGDRRLSLSAFVILQFSKLLHVQPIQLLCRHGDLIFLPIKFLLFWLNLWLSSFSWHKSLLLFELSYFWGVLRRVDDKFVICEGLWFAWLQKSGCFSGLGSYFNQFVRIIASQRFER